MNEFKRRYNNKVDYKWVFIQSIIAIWQVVLIYGVIVAVKMIVEAVIIYG